MSTASLSAARLDEIGGACIAVSGLFAYGVTITEMPSRTTFLLSWFAASLLLVGGFVLYNQGRRGVRDGDA